MVTTTEVEMAYRLMHGREPESPDVVCALALHHPTLADLGRTIIASAEFTERYARNRDRGEATEMRPPVWAPDTVQTTADAAGMGRLVERVERGFAHLGRTEPHWSVLTAEEFRSENIAAHEDAFFESGKGVDDLKLALAIAAIDLPASAVCFELGCGLGRSSLWLAETFNSVICADISQPHLAIARNVAARYGRRNIEFLHVNSVRAFEALPPLDAFFQFCSCSITRRH